MSFQPFPLTWYTSIPRTIAADCDFEYEFVPAVWCTIALFTLAANCGGARRIDSSAPQPARVINAGEPAIDRRRGGRASTGLQTRNARSRVTRPCVRYWIAADAPVQYGLAMRQPGGAGGSRPSSASGAAACHALQRPANERVRNETFPVPRQCTPTRSKRGVPVDISARSPCNGTSRATSDTPA